MTEIRSRLGIFVGNMNMATYVFTERGIDPGAGGCASGGPGPSITGVGGTLEDPVV